MTITDVAIDDDVGIMILVEFLIFRGHVFPCMYSSLTNTGEVLDVFR